MNPRIRMLKVIALMLTISRVTDPASPEVAFSYYSPDRASFCPSQLHKVPDKVSVIKCASLCLQFAGRGYLMQDGDCTIVGSLTEPSVGEKMSTYQRVSYLTNLENVALGKATESVDFWTSPTAMRSDLAVDGDESSANYFHSHPSVLQPWWYVDLGENREVYEVHVLPYGDGDHPIEFTTIEIRIGQELPATTGDFSSWSPFAYYPGPAPQEMEYLMFSPNSSHPICGRYVSIQKKGSNPNVFYAFNEVKVFAQENV